MSITLSGLHDSETPWAAKLRPFEIPKDLSAKPFSDLPAPLVPFPDNLAIGARKLVKGELTVNVSSGEAAKAQQNNSVKPSRTSSRGVGGDEDSTFIFRIGALSNRGLNPILNPAKTVRMELAPARRSFHDKGRIQPPGAGSGLEIRTRFNITKLNVPSSRPIYQHFGIAEETLEWVGAFIGTDVENKNSMGLDGKRSTLNTNAWEQSEQLTRLVREGQEIGIELEWSIVGWGVSAGNPLKVGLDGKKENLGTVTFTGYVKEFVKVYATEQRVYYRILVTLTNRQDINNFNSQARQINLPEKFVEAAANEESLTDIKALETQQQEFKSRGVTNSSLKELDQTIGTPNARSSFSSQSGLPDGKARQDLESALAVSIDRAKILNSKNSAVLEKDWDLRLPFVGEPGFGESEVTTALDRLSSALENPNFKNGRSTVIQAREALTAYKMQANYNLATSQERRQNPPPANPPPPPKPVPPNPAKPKPNPTLNPQTKTREQISRDQEEAIKKAFESPTPPAPVRPIPQ